MPTGEHLGTGTVSAVEIPVQAVQIAGTARLPSNLRIDSYQIITKPMLRIRSGQPGKPERALQRTGSKPAAVLAPGLIPGDLQTCAFAVSARHLSEPGPDGGLRSGQDNDDNHQGARGEAQPCIGLPLPEKLPIPRANEAMR